MSDLLVNKIAESGLITLKPEEWIPKATVAEFDLKEFLFMELILKEKDFREKMKNLDWKTFQDKILCIYCSADAIIPSWAYMLIASYASPFAAELYFGTPSEWRKSKLLSIVEQMDVQRYADERIIIKGCSEEFEIGPEIYLALTAKLVPVVKSLMFGEPCSTVPVYKRPKANG